MKVIKVSVQEDYIARHDERVFSLFVQTKKKGEAEFLKLNMPFTVGQLTAGLRKLADHLDKKYK